MSGPIDELFETPGTSEADDYRALLDDYSQFGRSAEGEIIHGHVLTVTDKEVIVDIGRKIEGLVPAAQFPLVDDKPDVHPGDVVEVMIDRSGEQPEGYILLSFERAHRKQAWENLEKIASEGSTVIGRVLGKVKGGLDVDIGGVTAFLPGSQLEPRPVHNLDPYIG
ncbi:MAG TPA: S1 RNA-binding domain-containing protein, partial [Bryobacteraceae bacterium]|nr:S1 RNA-binding domain-containing protein [Bryobacteraceae bacterium]